MRSHLYLFPVLFALSFQILGAAVSARTASQKEEIERISVLLEDWDGRIDLVARDLRKSRILTADRKRTKRVLAELKERRRVIRVELMNLKKAPIDDWTQSRDDIDAQFEAMLRTYVKYLEE